MSALEVVLCLLETREVGLNWSKCYCEASVNVCVCVSMHVGLYIHWWERERGTLMMLLMWNGERTRSVILKMPLQVLLGDGGQRASVFFDMYCTLDTTCSGSASWIRADKQSSSRTRKKINICEVSSVLSGDITSCYQLPTCQMVWKSLFIPAFWALKTP